MMMRLPILGLGLATVAFAGSSFYLYQQLEQERERAALVEQKSAELNARIAELEKARSQFVERRMVGSGNFIAGTFGSGPGAPPPPPPGEKSESKGEEQQVWTAMPRPDRSPAFRKMMRSQIRANNKRVYADVGTRLGLDKDTANKLIDLLTEQQLPDFNTREMSDPTEMQRYFDEKQRQNQAQIADLIGSDKAVDLQEYQESIPARMEVEMLARQLEGNDTALTAEQRNKLVDVYIEERKRVPMPDSYEGIDPEAYQKSVSAWQEDYAHRTAEEASRILNSEQLTAFNEMQQWQKEMREQAPTVIPGGAVRFRRGMAGNSVMFTTAAPVAVSASGNVAVAAPEQKKP